MIIVLGEKDGDTRIPYPTNCRSCAKTTEIHSRYTEKDVENVSRVCSP